MKLLLDQNISFRTIKGISHYFPDTAQVRALGLENATDIQIWEYAKTNGYTIVTFDSDFYEFSILKGIPPKVIWLRIGNSSTDSVIQKLLEYHEVISEFISSESYKEVECLEIY